METKSFILEILSNLYASIAATTIPFIILRVFAEKEAEAVNKRASFISFRKRFDQSWIGSVVICLILAPITEDVHEAVVWSGTILAKYTGFKMLINIPGGTSFAFKIGLVLFFLFEGVQLLIRIPWIKDLPFIKKLINGSSTGQNRKES